MAYPANFMVHQIRTGFEKKAKRVLEKDIEAGR